MSGNRVKLEDINEILQLVGRKENLKDIKIKFEDTAAKGDGYLGIITFITLEGKDVESKHVSLDLVVKSCPVNEKLREDFSIREAFLVESYMYSTVHQKLLNFQKKFNIPKPFKSVAKCYASIMHNLSEALVMENLKAAGFQLWNRKIPMNDEHVRSVLVEYGKYHALSHAFKKLHPLEYQKLAEGIKYDQMIDFFKKSIDSVKKLHVSVMDQIDTGVEPKFYEDMSRFGEELQRFLLEEILVTDESSVICHGDCWSNNLMFKYEGNEKKCPSEVRLLDWQCSAVRSPVIDVSYFYYACCSPDNYKYQDTYLHIYHGSLAQNLKEFGLDIEQIYPFSKLLAHWKTLCKYGYILSLYVVKAMLVDSDEVPDLVGSDTVEQALGAFEDTIANQDEYYNRMVKIARDIHERNLF